MFATICAIARVSTYDIRYAYPPNSEPLVGKLPDQVNQTLGKNWVWSDTCLGTSPAGTGRTIGCYWYAKTNVLDSGWISDSSLKYMFNATRTSSYKYMHIHFHE